MSEDARKSGEYITIGGTTIMAAAGIVSLGFLLMQPTDRVVQGIVFAGGVTGVGAGLAVTGIGNFIQNSAASSHTTKQTLDVAGRITLGVGLPALFGAALLSGTTKTVVATSGMALITTGSVCLGMSK